MGQCSYVVFEDLSDTFPEDELTDDLLDYFKTTYRTFREDSLDGVRGLHCFQWKSGHITMMLSMFDPRRPMPPKGGITP